MGKIVSVYEHFGLRTTFVNRGLTVHKMKAIMRGSHASVPMTMCVRVSKRIPIPVKFNTEKHTKKLSRKFNVGQTVISLQTNS